MNRVASLETDGYHQTSKMKGNIKPKLENTKEQRHLQAARCMRNLRGASTAITLLALNAVVGLPLYCGRLNLV